MAYFLRETSAVATNARVGLASTVSMPPDISLSSWELEFKVKLNATDWVLFADNFITSDDILFLKQTTCEVRRSAGGTVTFTLPENASTVERVYKLRTSGSGIELLQDGVSCGTLGISTNLFSINNFFTLGNSTRHGDFYYLKLTKDGVLEHDYDPSASSGTGSTLPDTVGSNDGTLVNFPTDDSQWVFYSTGAGADTTTANSTSTSHNPEVSAGAAATPTVATSASTGQYPAVAGGAAVTATTATSVSTAIDPVVSSGKQVNPTSAQSESAAHDPAIDSGALVTPTAGQSESTGNDPIVSAAQDGNVAPTVAESVSKSHDPDVASGAAVEPTPGQSESTAHDPVVGVVIQINPPVSTSVSQSHNPAVSAGVSIVVTPAESESAANDPVIGTYAGVTPTTAQSASVALDPNVSAGVARFVRKVQITGVLRTRATINGLYVRRVRL